MRNTPHMKPNRAKLREYHMYAGKQKQWKLVLSFPNQT